jgi:hypothetical protein
VTSGGGCDECSACCHLIGVQALHKAAGEWCPHVRPNGGGCGIYTDRPQACKTFECLWLQSQKSGLTRMPGEARPDRCHVVLTHQAQQEFRAVFAVTDPQYPRAFLQEPIQTYLRTAFEDGYIVVAGFKRRLWTLVKTGRSHYRFARISPTSEPRIIDPDTRLAIRLKPIPDIGVQVGYHYVPSLMPQWP